MSKNMGRYSRLKRVSKMIKDEGDMSDVEIMAEYEARKFITSYPHYSALGVGVWAEEQQNDSGKTVQRVLLTVGVYEHARTAVMSIAEAKAKRTELSAAIRAAEEADKAVNEPEKSKRFRVRTRPTK